MRIIILITIISINLTTIISINACEHKSYFFSPEESKQILNKLKGKKKTYTVSSIFYVSESNWIVWINGKAYTSIGKYKDFSLNKVLNDKIYITLDNGKTLILQINTK